MRLIIKIIPILFLFNQSPLFAQVSFKEFVETSNSTKKMMYAHDLWQYYLRNNTDSLKLLAIETYEFSNEKKSESLKLFSKRILGCYLVRIGDFVNGEKELKLALNYHRRNSDLANVTEDLNELGISNYLKGDYHSAESFFRLSLNSGKESPDESHTFLAELNLAKTYDKLGLNDRAKALAKRYLEQVEKLGKNESASNAYGFLSDLAIHEKNLPLAQEYLQKSLRKSNLTSNQIFLAQIYANLGSFHAGIEDFDSSRFYFEKSLEIRTKINHKKGILEAIYNLGSLDYTKNDFQAAEKHFSKGLELVLKENFISDQVDFLEILVEIQKELKNKDKEIEYYQKFIEVKSKQAEFLLKNKEEQNNLIEYFKEDEIKSKAEITNKTNFWSGFLLGMSSLITLLLVVQFFKPKLISPEKQLYDE
jgi:tetratricopeptide (TPR) repeat protein